MSISPVSECSVIFCFSYFAYVSSELLALSGIISLLTCAVIQAKYSWFNLSTQGRNASVVIFEFLGLIATGFVFSYLGLTFWFYEQYRWSSQLIYAEMIICICARFLGTFGLLSIAKLCGYEKDNVNKLTYTELTFICFAGLIRGAIAFGLVLRLDPNIYHRSVIVTTCLTLVVFTTVFLGSTIGLLAKCLFHQEPKQDQEEEIDDMLSNNSKLKVLIEKRKMSINDKMNTLHYNAGMALEEEAEEAKAELEDAHGNQYEYIQN